jgi:hypothetical protein
MSKHAKLRSGTTVERGLGAQQVFALSTTSLSDLQTTPLELIFSSPTLIAEMTHRIGADAALAALTPRLR